MTEDSAIKMDSTKTERIINNISGEAQRDYLAEYDAAAEADKYPLVKLWMQTEPLPFFKQLRQERPILVTPECTLLALAEDVRDALQMPTIFTAQLYRSKMGVRKNNPGYMTANDDNALSTREKAIMQMLLDRNDLPYIRQLIADAARTILQNANGRIDAVNEYCRRLPVILVQQYFGLDGVAEKKLMNWSFWNQYDSFYNHPFDLRSKEDSQRISGEYISCSKEFIQYLKSLILRKLIHVKLRDPLLKLLFKFINPLLTVVGQKPKAVSDDIVKRMLRTGFVEQVNFPMKRMGMNIGGLLVGTIETTAKSAAQVIQFFIRHPELLVQAKLAAAKDDVTEIDNMVWEALRFVPISPYLFRTMGQDYTIAVGTDREMTLQQGTTVLPLTQSAMFDPANYESPDEYNPDRNWYRHFAYGFGAHECLGKYIGMVMLPEMVRHILLCDDLNAEAPIDYQGGPFPEKYILNWSC